MNASMVPMFGAIMPEPLQIPATEKPSPRIRACFSTRSVVMIARAAAASASSERASEPARPAACRSIRGRSRYRPITPVEATPTSRSSTPRARPPIAAMAAASSRPRRPVWAFAQPEFATIPPSRPRRIRSIISSIGGARTRFEVKTPAAVPSARIRARPYLPSLMPAASTPSIAQIDLIPWTPVLPQAPGRCPSGSRSRRAPRRAPRAGGRSPRGASARPHPRSRPPRRS